MPAFSFCVQLSHQHAGRLPVYPVPAGHRAWHLACNRSLHVLRGVFLGLPAGAVTHRHLGVPLPVRAVPIQGCAGAASAWLCWLSPQHACHQTHRRLLFCITGTIACAGLMGPAFLLVRFQRSPSTFFDTIWSLYVSPRRTRVCRAGCRNVLCFGAAALCNK